MTGRGPGGADSPCAGSPTLERVQTSRELADALSGPAGVVRVLARHGFGTVESGQLLVAGADDVVAGTLLRGALDTPAVDLARDARRAPSVLDAHVAEVDAVAAGLACAGGATLLGHPIDAAVAAALREAFTVGVPAALVAAVDGTAVLALTGRDL